MTNLANALYNIRLLDDLAKKNTPIHALHPLVKLLTTVIYLAVVMSFGRYEISKLLPFIFFPLVVALLAELPLMPIVHRLLMVLPLIIGIGISNPIIDNQTITILGVDFSRDTFRMVTNEITIDLNAGLSLFDKEELTKKEDKFIKTHNLEVLNMSINNFINSNE